VAYPAPVPGVSDLRQHRQQARRGIGGNIREASKVAEDRINR
jgi:hypothetical protein